LRIGDCGLRIEQHYPQITQMDADGRKGFRILRAKTRTRMARTISTLSFALLASLLLQTQGASSLFFAGPGGGGFDPPESI